MRTLSKRLLQSCSSRGNLVATAFTLLIALSLAEPNLEAREFVSADVKIANIAAAIDQAAATLTCTVSVHSDNDDDARFVKMLVILPLEVQFKSASVAPTGHWTMCEAPVGGSGGVGNVSCELGSMGVGEAVTVTVVTTAPASDISRKSCGAFVWSKMPDPDGSNNYKISTEP